MTNAEITSIMDNFMERHGRSKVLGLLSLEAEKLSSAANTMSMLLDLDPNAPNYKANKAMALKTMHKAVSNIEILEIMLDLTPMDSYQKELMNFMRM